MGCCFIVKHSILLACLSLILKNTFDYLDGLLARTLNKTSITGRYLDSLSDFLVNGGLVLSICLVTNTHIVYGFITLFLIHIQCSLFNYYYVIKRVNFGTESTVSLDESNTLSNTSSSGFFIHFLHTSYLLVYYWQDKIVHWFDPTAKDSPYIPNWFMSYSSLLCFGSHLFVIMCCLVFNRLDVAFFIINGGLSLIAISCVMIRQSRLCK